MAILSIQSTHVHQNMNIDFLFSVTMLILSYVTGQQNLHNLYY